MKKLFLIIAISLLCVSLVSAADYMFVVDNEGMASDVVNTINTIQNLKNKGLLDEGDYEDTTTDEIDDSDLKDKVTVFIINGKATIVIGRDADTGSMEFAAEMRDSLNEVSGIEADIVYSDDESANKLIKEQEAAEENATEPAENITEEPETEEQEAEEEEQTANDSVVIISEPETPGLFERIINWFKSLFS